MVALGEASWRTRPFEDWELPFLERFSGALARHRALAGLSYRRLRLATGLAISFLHDLEHGERRPRHSTIRRIARALAESRGAFCLADDIAEELIEAIGAAAAPESPSMERIERRRDRHVKKLAKDPNAVLRPPHTERERLEKQLRYAERELHELRRQRDEIEARAEELRLKQAVLDRREQQVQARELQLWERGSRAG